MKGIKVIVVIFLILGLITMTYAGSLTMTKATMLAENHAKEDVNKAGTFILGVLFPILTPIISFVRSYSIPSHRLYYVESLTDDPAIMSAYIQTYKSTRRTTAGLWGLGGTVANIFLTLFLTAASGY
ncbi:MAG: hypothetical protein ACP5D6_02665 [Kosmotogaceae bacterium]